MMTITVIVAFFIFERDTFVYKITTYLWILAAIVALIALILIVSYRISLSKIRTKSVSDIQQDKACVLNIEMI